MQVQNSCNNQRLLLPQQFTILCAFSNAFKSEQFFNLYQIGPQQIHKLSLISQKEAFLNNMYLVVGLTISNLEKT